MLGVEYLTMEDERIRLLEMLPGEPSPTDLGRWYSIMRDDPCPFCGVWMTSTVGADPAPTDATKDHIEPRSNGASASYENIAIVCRECNSQKADRSLLEHLHEGGMRRRPPPDARHAVSRSRHRAAWVVQMAREYFGPEILSSRSRGARKRRRLIAWVSLRIGARPRHVAKEMSISDRGTVVVEMAQAWERRLGEKWTTDMVRGFVAYLRERNGDET